MSPASIVTTLVRLILLKDRHVVEPVPAPTLLATRHLPAVLGWQTLGAGATSKSGVGSTAYAGVAVRLPEN